MAACWLAVVNCPREQQRRHFKPSRLDTLRRVQPACQPRFLTRLVEEAEVIERAHAYDMCEIERGIQRQRRGGPLEHDLPIEPAVERAGCARNCQMRVGQRRVLLERPACLLLGTFPPLQCLGVIRVAHAEPGGGRCESGTGESVVLVERDRLLEVRDGLAHIGLGVIDEERAPAEIQIVGRGILGISNVQPRTFGRGQFNSHADTTCSAM